MLIQDWQAWLNQALGFAGTFSIEMVLVLLVLCIVGEGVGLSVPYLLETIWLMAGYHLVSGTLSVPQLITLLLVAQTGRQGGLLALYYSSRGGSRVFVKAAKRLKWDKPVGKILEWRIGPKVDLLSPFAVALGRLLWMRIPLTLLLGAQNKLRPLLLGAVISSLVYDGTYIIIGAVMGRVTKLQPLQITLLFLAVLTVFWLITFTVRRLWRLAAAN